MLWVALRTAGECYQSFLKWFFLKFKRAGRLASKKGLHDPKAGVEPVATWPLLSAEGRHGRRVDGLPQDVPPGSGILAQGCSRAFSRAPRYLR